MRLVANLVAPGGRTEVGFGRVSHGSERGVFYSLRDAKIRIIACLLVE